MMINLSNHPVSKWDASQLAAAEALSGNVVDYQFPNVDPQWDTAQVNMVADSIVNEIISVYGTDSLSVHIAGEFTMCYALVSEFKNLGVRCVTSCSHRDVVELPDGTKNSRFVFVRFREY